LDGKRRFNAQNKRRDSRCLPAQLYLTVAPTSPGP
jgi:hypothetical protein